MPVQSRVVARGRASRPRLLRIFPVRQRGSEGSVVCTRRRSLRALDPGAGDAVSDEGANGRFRSMVEASAFMDRFYISTRYPNGLPDLTPGKAYFLRDAEQALERGAWLLARCRILINAIRQEHEEE